MTTRHRVTVPQISATYFGGRATTMHTAEQLEQRMLELAHNLWWTWHPEALEVWRGIDPELWRKCRHSPISFIKNLGKKRIDSLCTDLELCIKINKKFSDLERYLKTTAGRHFNMPDERAICLRKRPPLRAPLVPVKRVSGATGHDGVY